MATFEEQEALQKLRNQAAFDRQQQKEKSNRELKEIGYKNQLEKQRESQGFRREQRREQRMGIAREKVDAKIIEGDNAIDIMKLQHQLDIENRNLDFQEKRLHDNQDLSNLSLELLVRSKDDAVSRFWDLRDRVAIIKIEANIKQAQTNLEHENAKNFETHKAILEQNMQSKTKEDVAKVMDQMMKDGIIQPN